MGSGSQLWNIAGKYMTAGLIAFTVQDRYISYSQVQGSSMSPTLNPRQNSVIGLTTNDWILYEKWCLEKYRFLPGDVVVYSSPENHKERHIKRITALPGDWVAAPSSSDTVIQIPEGHCWVEGDNSASSMDSRSCGPIPLGLIRGRVTHVVWPPQRVGAVERKVPHNRLVPL
ncbi:unnamed protein product [Rhodiola kirilowii]